MKRILKNKIKNSRIFYSIYFTVGSFLIRFLGLFVKFDEKLILFSSFGGRKYDDSPLEIYLRMIEDPRFADYKFIWGFEQPDKFSIPVGEKCATDTFAYYKACLAARCWITNSSIERGLSFKRKGTLFFNTWHGTPIKKMGTDIGDTNASFRGKGDDTTDYMCAQSAYDRDIFSRVFRIDIDKFLISGLPRNDILYNHTQEYRRKIRGDLMIEEHQKVILYAPTFREYEQDSESNYTIEQYPDFHLWQSVLGSDYVVLFRAHYAIYRHSSKTTVDADFVRDVSDYPTLNDLIIASDMLVSDYSSLFFDYSITNKPMIAYTYDYDAYQAQRGMYFDIRNYISSASNEDELLSVIRTDGLNDKTQKFMNAFVDKYGSATEICVEKIYAEIS